MLVYIVLYMRMVFSFLLFHTEKSTYLRDVKTYVSDLAFSGKFLSVAGLFVADKDKALQRRPTVLLKPQCLASQPMK